MEFPLISDVGTLVLSFIVLLIGYSSLLAGYILSGKQKEFLTEKEIKATDKITISFIIGSFSYILLQTIAGELNVETIMSYLLYIVILIMIFSLTISILLLPSKNR